jgi:hypothetical protein
MDLWTAVAATAGCDTLALRGDPVASPDLQNTAHLHRRCVGDHAAALGSWRDSRHLVSNPCWVARFRSGREAAFTTAYPRGPEVSCGKSAGPTWSLPLHAGHGNHLDVLSLALIGNASGKVVPSGWKPCSEAFSIRRLGGSRWRLRRTRGAMGFEWQSKMGVKYGRAAENAESAGVVVVGAGSERIGKPARKLFCQGEDTNGSACWSTSSGRG